MDNGCYNFSDKIEWNFDWSDVSGATRYNLFVKNLAAEHPTIDIEITASEYYHWMFAYISNLNDWTWKVRAGSDESIWSDWSDERSFTVEPIDTDCP